MGVVENISADRWPTQGCYLGARVEVCFHYDTSRRFRGIVLRDDAEEPGRMVIQLDNGRVVLATECQFSPFVEPATTDSPGNAPEGE